jgi:hypothetical protein
MSQRQSANLRMFMGRMRIGDSKRQCACPDEEETTEGDMREILFRGKHVSSGEFVYGLLSFYDEERAIISSNEQIPIEYFVHPETVWQYTGLKDKNGTKIFEGDFFEDGCGLDACYVAYCNRCKSFQIHGSKYKQGCFSCLGYFHWHEAVKYDDLVIKTNINDNPELLGGKKP